jgi:hypothetical protein
MKRCSKCGSIKPESEFYKDERTPDGLKCQCKKCHCQTSIKTRDEDKKRDANKRYMRRAVAGNPDKFRAQWKNRKKPDVEKKAARAALNAAVRAGRIVRPDICPLCGAEARITAHHSDYSKPLDVEWLCYECHGRRHRRPA